MQMREEIVGRQGLGTMNSIGKRFVELFGNQSLVVGVTLFGHKDSHKVTFVSSHMVTQN